MTDEIKKLMEETEQGNAQSEHELALRYMNGDGVPQNTKDRKSVV